MKNIEQPRKPVKIQREPIQENLDLRSESEVRVDMLKKNEI